MKPLPCTENPVRRFHRVDRADPSVCIAVPSMPLEWSRNFSSSNFESFVDFRFPWSTVVRNSVDPVEQRMLSDPSGYARDSFTGELCAVCEGGRGGREWPGVTGRRRDGTAGLGPGGDGTAARRGKPSRPVAGWKMPSAHRSEKRGRRGSGNTWQRQYTAATGALPLEKSGAPETRGKSSHAMCRWVKVHPPWAQG